MKKKIMFFLFLNLCLFSWSVSMNNVITAKSVYDFQVKDINGNDVNLSQYAGKVILIVNVASKCGFTYQYEELETLYKKYKDSGLVILGFPANNFMGQEPGTNSEIKSFCSLTYGVTFPMFSKISVKGKDKAPLYVYLTDKQENPKFGGEITWNFNKFLINKNGEIINRFDSKVSPKNKKIVDAIESALNN
jgi:glutathione peroxidase